MEKACTVLIHKKGDATEMGKFRTITLARVPLNIFTSCLRDSLFSFLAVNGFIEQKIQKQFMPKLSGTSEHTARMANSINTARIKKGLLLSLYSRGHQPFWASGPNSPNNTLAISPLCPLENTLALYNS